MFRPDKYSLRSRVMLYFASSPSKTTVRKNPIRTSRAFSASKNFGLMTTSYAVQPLPTTIQYSHYRSSSIHKYDVSFNIHKHGYSLNEKKIYTNITGAAQDEYMKITIQNQYRYIFCIYFTSATYLPRFGNPEDIHYAAKISD